MKITEDKITMLFSEGDIISSGGKQSYYALTEIMKDRVRFRPIGLNKYGNPKGASRLWYNKLEIIIDNFDSINGNKVEASVRTLLQSHSMDDTQNESYLFGFAREYIKRKNKLLNLMINSSDKEKTYTEGRAYLKRHLAKERNTKLIKDAKDAFLRENGSLFCQVCGFNFNEAYGNLGENYIEGHHISPFHLTNEARKSKISDIAMVCSNCHRMLHRKKSSLSIENLKQIIDSQ